MAQKSILKDKPSALISKYYYLLKKKNIPVEKIILFGSYAKGKTKPWSDLDLCIVSKEFGKNRFEEMVLLKKIASLLEPLIEPHPYHPDDLRDQWDPLAAEIRKYGKTYQFG